MRRFAFRFFVIPIYLLFGPLIYAMVALVDEWDAFVLSYKEAWYYIIHGRDKYGFMINEDKVYHNHGSSTGK